MATGIIVKGDNGRVQIDGTYQNLFVADSGQGGAVPAAGEFSDGAVVAFQCPSLALATFGNSVPSTCRWWVFDVLSGTASSYGLVIRNASGKVVFDALKKPMRISGDITGSSNIGSSVAFPTGRQYAAIPMSTGGRFTEGSVKAGSNQWTNTDKAERVGAKVSGNDVTIGWITTRNDVTTGPDQLYEQGSHTTAIFDNVSYIIVDVTDY